ncbi:glycosyl transferase family 2 [Rhodobacter aestuarii]|uniref:Glycosyl transferase family 2 n=1 Tax=Rhodobacter aestuarii TaxID=453582 RepID=A0A1N7QDL0_9RHOB|nr:MULTISPECIES: glycosyltransferase [Rhodobacter]PTV93586.1 glycosyl transferase family 2 [Rhodobacter aestuarii]SIT20884.1 Glycosyl transferase family 2 [Rhodobacter aestuarii]SOC16132.1 glycosyl transferase family 2 [Rhodobacter sp. JA431]
MKGLSCIIPAYNEAPRIEAVLNSVIDHPLIDEVIVVDDGSRDGTAEIAARVPGIRLIRLPQNRGKSWAVAEGVAAAEHELILLLDSDLLGLAPESLASLIFPVRDGRADVTISLRGNAPLLWRLIGLDYISGERVLPKALIGAPEALRALPRFGLEMHLNRRMIAARARIMVVEWPKVASPWKGSKRGAWEGIKADAKMLADMFRTVPLHSAMAQIWAMIGLRAPTLY